MAKNKNKMPAMKPTLQQTPQDVRQADQPTLGEDYFTAADNRMPDNRMPDKRMPDKRMSVGMFVKWLLIILVVAASALFVMDPPANITRLNSALVTMVASAERGEIRFWLRRQNRNLTHLEVFLSEKFDDGMDTVKSFADAKLKQYSENDTRQDP